MLHALLQDAANENRPASDTGSVHDQSGLTWTDQGIRNGDFSPLVLHGAGGFFHSPMNNEARQDAMQMLIINVGGTSGHPDN